MVFYPPNWGCDGGHGPVGLLYGQLGPDQKHPDAEVFMESGTVTNLDNRDTTPFTMNTCGPERALAAYQGSLNATPVMKRPRSCSRSSTLYSSTQPPRLCCLYNSVGITCLMMNSRDRHACARTHTVLIYRNYSS